MSNSVAMARGLIVILMILVGGLPGLVWARQPADEPAMTVMGEIVVTASRQEEAVARVPAHVTVISAEEIGRTTARNVPEVLKTLAGVHVSDISGNQRNYYVDLRGFGESAPQNVLLLVDGRRINLPDLSGPDWNLVPLDRIERIEVIRGSRGNLLYGDNATAGVVNIITKEGRGLESRMAAKYGSYDTFGADVAVGGSHGIMGFDLSTSYLDSRGYRDNSDSDAKDVGLNLTVDPARNLRLHVSSGYHYDHTRNPGALLQSDLRNGLRRTDTTHPLDYDKTEDLYLKGGLELDMLSDDTFMLETSYRRRDKSSYGTYAGGFWFEAETQTQIVTVSPQLVFRSDFEGLANTIILGVDHSLAEQDYDSNSGFGPIRASLEKKNTGYFVHDELSIGNHWGLSGGYRHDRATFKYEPADIGKRLMKAEAFGVGVNYRFGSGSHLYAGFNRGFRYPVLDEQFTYATSSVNTSLRPEALKGFEVGGTMAVAPGLGVQLNLFRIETKDQIFYNPETYNNENMPWKTIRQGVEAGLVWQRHSLRTGAGYTLTDASFDKGPYEGNTVPCVPRDKATAFIHYEIVRGLSIGLDAIYVGAAYLISDFHNAFPKTESYTVFNAGMRYDWRWLTFSVDLNNLFNEKYAAYSGLSYNINSFDYEPGVYPSPEFNILAGISARFGGR